MTSHCDRAAWLHGGEVKCANGAAVPARPFRLVLLGAPGVGKGTQAEMLSSRLGACQLSTGDVFRAAKSADPASLGPVMRAALGHMKRGELVPDETVIDMVRERAACLRCPYGFMLDGFPRTAAQAEALDDMLRANGVKLDAVLDFELPMEHVVARLSGRRTCRDCKTTFHVEGKPPRAEGVCDHCGGELYTREDDRPESIRVRLQAYEHNTTPLADYYHKKGILRTVSADGAPADVFARALEALGL
ncbi:MAG: nucleoside monophosphate kinase [Candidatus Sumerlaeota bacterium]|nr:nucleoside monophosphate kinase [Candidatus Sumerlaeota bacterium]